MIQTLETLVRSGKLDEARQVMRKISIRKIKRKEALLYANLARRLEDTPLSVRILNPIVRARNQRVPPASPQELIEYAASLRSLGLLNEAAELLREIDARKHPQAGFQLALCHFTEWRYQPCIPLLQDYLRTLEPGSYAEQVGSVNLLQALIHEGCTEDAGAIVTKLLESVDRKRNVFLLQRSLELAAQYEITLRSNPGRAIEHLKAASALLDAAQDSIHALLIQKWVAIAQSTRAGGESTDFSKIRSEARRLRAWEIVRDCDFYQAKIAGDQEGLVRLYFGTPFASYRAKILERLGGSTGALPPEYLWRQDGGGPSGSRQVFNLLHARFEGPETALALAPQALHRLLIILCQDFYKPAALLSLFSKLFPREHFDPDHSPNRVHQTIFRFRKWCESAALPFGLEAEEGSYRLELSKSAGIAIPRKPLPLDSSELSFLRLRSLLPGSSFTAREAQQALRLSKTTVSLLLKWAVENGKLGVQGQTDRVLYTAGDVGP